MAKKICKHDGCITPLSIYNKGDYCFAHTEGMPVVERFPITLCTCFDPEEFKSRTRPSYGTEAYQDMAFTKEVTGFVDKDGEVKPIFEKEKD